jgi:zinc protease
MPELLIRKMRLFMFSTSRFLLSTATVLVLSLSVTVGYAQGQAEVKSAEGALAQKEQNLTAEKGAFLSKLKAENEPFYNAKMTTLSNGMQVVVIENHRAPVLTHMVWYKVGGADEPVGISGTAHFLEHLLFKGTEKQTPGEFSEIVKNMGGRNNAFTSWDYTAYFETIPSQHLEKVMHLEADRMRNANPPHDHFLTERDVVLEERRQTLDNNPAARLSEQIRNALYVNHPYGRPIVGWMNEIEALGWPEIKEFYDRWYSPSNAVLVVAGDVKAEDLFKKADEIYGVIEAFDVPQNARPKRAVFDTAKTIEMHDALVKQKSFRRMTLADTVADKPIDSLVVSLIGMMLDGGATSRLYKSIVVEQQKAVSAYFSFNGFARDYGSMSYGGTPVDGVSFEQLEQAMLEVFAKAALEGFTEEELARAKSRIIDAQIFELDSVTGPAMVFGRAMMVGVDPEYLEYWTAALDAITLEHVNAKAKEILPRVNGALAKTKKASAAWRQSVYGYLYPLQESDADETKKSEGE